MKINIEGDINRFYVQNLSLIFFPGEKFSENEPDSVETPIVSIKAEKDEESVTVYAKIEYAGNVSEAVRNEKMRRGTFGSSNSIGEINEKKTMNIALGRAIFEAGEKMFGYRPSWGILTGIRPAKLAADLYIKEHLTESEIIGVLNDEYLVNPKKANLVADIVKNEAEILKKVDDNCCSVYISIPFCPSRCAYCSFVSYSTKRLLSLIPDYLERLKADIKRTFDLIKRQGLRVVTIYIGGGTPTILTADQIRDLLECVGKNIDVSTLLEFTLEAGRPDTITAEKLQAAREGGITRISVNPQTVNNEVLERIGRRHTAEDFFRAYDIARNSGIKYINTDLIAGLPGENFAKFSKSVDAILALRPDNVTFHTFCVKKSADVIKNETEIYSRTGGDTGKSVDYTQMKAKLAGYIPYYIYRNKNTLGNYENVGYSFEGAEGLYNIFIMEEIHSIFAIGAGGVTKMLKNGDKKNISRQSMPKYPYEYLAMKEEDINREFELIERFYTEN